METNKVGNQGLNPDDWVFPKLEPEVVRSGIIERVWSTVSALVWPAQPQVQEPCLETFHEIDHNGNLERSILVAPLSEKGENPVVALLAPPHLRSEDCDDEKYDGPSVTQQFVKDALRSVGSRKIYLNGKHFPVETTENAGQLAKEILNACRSQEKFRKVSEVFNQRIQIDLRSHVIQKTKKLLGEKLAGCNPFLREQDIKDMSIWFNTRVPNQVIVKGQGELSWATREEDLELVNFPPHFFRAKATYDLQDGMIYYKSEITPVGV